MSYEQLSLSSFIKEIKEVSDGPHPRKFCFILGAGASRTSGIKSGQELVKIWDKDLRERNEEEYHHWRESLGITNSNMSNYYSQYYEKRFYRCPADGYNYIEKIMDSAKPSAGYVMLAHILTTTPHNVVITTNFDHLTEDAINYYAQSTPLVIGHESLSHYVSGQPVRPTVVKIHHDLLFDPKSRTKDLEVLHDNWKTALGLIFANYHPIFIGYAGNDKSLMDFLLENSNKFSSDEWKYPYWMVYKTDALEHNVQLFLEKSGGYFIRHNGFDNVLIQLGATFEYVIPNEESFLEDAKKRYRALADAIDAMSFIPKTPGSSGEASNTMSDSLETILEHDDSNDDECDIHQAIERITSHSEIHRMYREVINLSNKEQFQEALELCEHLVALDPKNARYYNTYGDILHKLEKNDEALEAYRNACQLSPEDGWNHYSIGNILEEKEQYEEALAEYYQASDLEPENGFFYFCIATMLEQLGEYDNALYEILKAVELEPDESMNHYATGSIFEKMEQYENALAAYTRAAVLEPNDEMNHFKAAEMSTVIGDYESALSSIEKSISIAPTYKPSYDLLIFILQKLGRDDDALIATKKLEELKKQIST